MPTRPGGKSAHCGALSRWFRRTAHQGRHHFLRHADGWTTVVPVHGSETISAGLLAKILRDCELTRDQLRQVLYWRQLRTFVYLDCGSLNHERLNQWVAKSLRDAVNQA